MNITVKYDTPIEVTRDLYNKLMHDFAGIVAGRIEDDGRCYIKVWVMKYAKHIESILNETASRTII